MESAGEQQREERLMHAKRCTALGVRPQWEREFRYYPHTDPGHRAANARLAAEYPRAAWEHAREDEAFQRFLAKAVKQAR